MKLVKKKDIYLIKRAFKYLYPYRLRVLFTLLCIIIGVIINTIQPFIWATLLSELFSKNLKLVLFNIMLIAAIYLLQELFRFLQVFLLAHLSENIIYDIKSSMFKAMLNIPVKAFDENTVGEFMSRIQGDASCVANIITTELLKLIIDILKVICIGVVLFKINVKLFLLVVVAFPLASYVFLIFGNKLRNKNKELAKINDNMFSMLREYISGIREIKSLGIKNYCLNNFLSILNNIKVKNIEISILKNFSQSVFQSGNFFTQLAVIIFGTFYVFSEKLTMQYFIAFSSYSSQFSLSLISITNMNVILQQTMVSLERVFSLIDNLNYKKEFFGKSKSHNIIGKVEFKDVYFQYNENNYTLKGISFKAKQGKITAIVGMSGGGKSTILNLLLRFYEPSSGKITIDGIDINNFTEESLRHIISVVRQEIFLFNSTIMDNLLLAKKKATKEDVYAACKFTFIHDFIMSLPKGYDSILGENAINLSAGQRQKIAIARAILKESKIILFDEATSSLDNESQYHIKKVIENLSINHSIIIIAHRLITIVEADEILVIENGRIVGTGTHELLIQHNDVYKKLYTSEIDIINKRTRDVI